MILKDFVEIMHSAMGLRNKKGAMMGKSTFLRELLCLNIDGTQEPSFLDSPDTTFASYIKRGFSKEVAVELLKVLEQSNFIKKIDDLSDEQQDAIYQNLSQLDLDVNYENLSQCCADIFKEIVHNSAFKDNKYNKNSDDLSQCDKSEDTSFELKRYWNKPKDVWIVHYACTNFNDPIYPARITCIAIRPLSDTSTKLFSILNEAQKIHLDIEKIQQNLDLLESKMLSHFFDFVHNLHQPTWLHWNMRDAQYGFEAIENRYQCLTDKNNAHIHGKKVDIADAFQKIYGSNYANHPRLQCVCILNDISQLNFITGAEEAQAFLNGEYNKIQNSLLRKLCCIHSLVQKCVDNSLKTNQTVNATSQLSTCIECPYRTTSNV